MILGVSKNEIIFHQIMDENINSNNFVEILSILNDKIKEKKNKKFVLILDNCSVDKTDEVIKYLYEQDLCALFKPAYHSTFKPIELAFRAIKKFIF